MTSRFRVLGVTALLFLAVSALSAGSAFAKGNGGATLTINPSPASTDSVVQISGCGYTVGAPSELVFQTPTATEFAGVPVGSNGCIATSVYVYGTGSYSAQIF